MRGRSRTLCAHAASSEQPAPIAPQSSSYDAAAPGTEERAAAAAAVGEPGSESSDEDGALLADAAPDSIDPSAKHLGILGGGQLGQMMALSAVRMHAPARM